MKLLKVIVLLLSFTTVAQNLSKDELLVKLSDLTCKCSENKEVTKESIEMDLGLCIVETLENYENEIIKYYGSDYLEKNMSKIGKEIGFKLMGNCPKLSKLFFDKAKLKTGKQNNISINGLFIDTSIEGFLFVNIKEDSGKTHQFVLINSFENAFLITDKVLNPKDKVEINYFEAVLFNVKSNKFENYKILNDIKKL